MSVLFDNEVIDAPTGDDDPMVHISCVCSPKHGLCGMRLIGIPFAWEVEADCIVCEDLYQSVGCPKCGL